MPWWRVASYLPCIALNATGRWPRAARKPRACSPTRCNGQLPGTLFWLLTNGVVRHGMPVWSKLPELQRWQLVRFIKSLTSATQASSNGKKQLISDRRKACDLPISTSI
jgi:hypothetical protein